MKLNTNKILRHMAYLSLLISGILLILVLYWLVRPYNPIEFDDGDFKVLTPEVMQGEYLQYEVSYCRKECCSPSVSLAFIDGIIYETPNSPQPFYEAGCHTKTFLVYVPKALPTGDYYLQHNFEFQVNLIRKVNVLYKTQMFSVIEN